MSANKTTEPIPRDVALRVCEEIRKENEGKRFSWAAMQCGGCVKFSQGNPDKMCFSSRSDNRGCSLVNRRYDKGRN